MAEWKKVIIAGSSVSQLTNDAGYLTAQTATTAFKSASFNGVIIEASQSISGSLGVEGLQFNIETGSVSYDAIAAPSGSGLLISASAEERKATFYLSGIPTASLQHTGSYIGRTKLGLGEVVATNSASAIQGAYFNDINATGSFSGSFIGDGSKLTNVAAGTRLATGSMTASVSAQGDIFKVENNKFGQGTAFRILENGSAEFGYQLFTNNINASSSFIFGPGANYVGTASGFGNGGEYSLIGGGDSNTANAQASLIWGSSNTVGPNAQYGTIAFGQGISVSGSTVNPLRQVYMGLWNTPVSGAGDLIVIGNGTSNSNRSNLALFTTSSIHFYAPVTGSSFTGSFVGDGSGLTGLVTKLNLSGSNPEYGFLTGSIDLKTQSLQITGSGKEIEVTLVTGSNNTYFQVGLPSDVAISQSLTIGRNLTVDGDLLIKGTASFISTQDLFVADRFIVIASGSTGPNDSGIIVDRGAYVSGSVGYGYDSTLNRWGYQANMTDTSNALTIDTNDGNSAFASYIFTETDHGAADALLTGEFAQPGAFYVSGSEGSLYILV
jgi:hypothetical protein